MLFTNLDVTTHTLSWLVTFIADDTGIQHRLCDEMEAAKGDVVQYCQSKDNLLHFCLMETLRLRPPASMLPTTVQSVQSQSWAVFTVPEYINDDLYLSGFLIPAKVWKSSLYGMRSSFSF